MVPQGHPNPVRKSSWKMGPKVVMEEGYAPSGRVVTGVARMMYVCPGCSVVVSGEHLSYPTNVTPDVRGRSAETLPTKGTAPGAAALQ